MHKEKAKKNLKEQINKHKIVAGDHRTTVSVFSAKSGQKFCII